MIEWGWWHKGGGGGGGWRFHGLEKGGGVEEECVMIYMIGYIFR